MARGRPGGRGEDTPESGGDEVKGLRQRAREGHTLWVDDATSERMARVRQRGTRPELVVRQQLARLGHRYRLENRELSGSPDVANRRQRWCVFVHGCFWHRHGCKATTTPGRNREFWEAKFARNVARDQRAIEALRELGYRVVVIWECQTKAGAEVVRAELMTQLGAASGAHAELSAAAPETRVAARRSRRPRPDSVSRRQGG